jgi:hypothetical protein
VEIESRQFRSSSWLNCTVNSDIPCLFPDRSAAFAAKQHVTPDSSVAWGEIPWIPCTVPCLKSRFRAFWA